MKDSSIRFRISTAGKARLEETAANAGHSVSEILRRASEEIICGCIPGVKQRQACAHARAAANAVLDAMDAKPIEISILKARASMLRGAARELIACT